MGRNDTFVAHLLFLVSVQGLKDLQGTPNGVVER